MKELNQCDDDFSTLKILYTQKNGQKKCKNTLQLELIKI